MKVLFWTGKFWPEIGGTATFATRLLPILQQRGYEFLVVAAQTHPGQSLQDCFEGIPIERFPFWDPDSYKMIDRLSAIKQRVKCLKRAFSPDLIHLSTLSLSQFFHLETRKESSSRVVVTLHGFQDPSSQAPEIHATMGKKILNSADWVTGVSSALLDQARSLTPSIIPRSSVIHNGLAPPSVLPMPLPGPPPVLVFLGRLAPEKGVERVLKILPSLKTHWPSIRLIIAGDGPERPKLEGEASRLGLNKNVEFLGMIDGESVPHILNQATLVVMPSRQESFGFVALEAALMGRPVVATKVGGLPEIIVHSETGLLVPDDDNAELCSSIRYLLENPGTAEQMGGAARRHAMKNFSMQRCVEAYDALYQRIGNGTVPPHTFNEREADVKI